MSFICNQCLKKFATEKSLKTHIVTHYFKTTSSTNNPSSSNQTKNRYKRQRTSGNAIAELMRSNSVKNTMISPLNEINELSTPNLLHSNEIIHDKNKSNIDFFEFDTETNQFLNSN